MYVKKRGRINNYIIGILDSDLCQKQKLILQ